MVFVLRQRHLADARTRQRGGGDRGADLAIAHGHDKLVAGIRLAQRRPIGQQAAGRTIEPGFTPLGQRHHRVARALALGIIVMQHARGFAQLLNLAGKARLRAGPLLVAAHCIGNLGEIAHAGRRHDHRMIAGVAACHVRQTTTGFGGSPRLIAAARAAAQRQRQAERNQLGQHALIERGHTIIVETRGLRAEDRHLVGCGGPELAIALVLLADIAQGIERALAIELVDGHEIGEIEHVNFFELAGRTKLGGHDIERGIDQRHDRGIALTDARGLDHDQIKARHLAGGDHIGQRLADLAAGIAGGERAHEDIGMVDGIHANAIAKQGPARLASRGVDRNDRDAKRIVLIETQATHQLVGQARLAGTPGTGDAQRRCSDPIGALAKIGAHRGKRGGIKPAGRRVVFERGDELGQRAARAGDVGTPRRIKCPGARRHHDRIERDRRERGEVEITARDHVADHAGQTELLAVFRRVDPGHAIVVQLADFSRHDHTAAAAEDLHMTRTIGAQQVDHVLEVLNMTALVGRHRNALHIFLQRAVDHLAHRAVVTQMNDLAAHALQNAPHDVDRRIVAVEERGRGDEPDLVRHAVFGEFLGV